MENKIAIHQPNFLPWAGYFLKMAASDIFILHDNVEINMSGPTRRVKIAARHTADHTQWLTIPLKKNSDYALIKDLEVSTEIDWRRKHLSQVKEAYRHSKYFSLVYPELEAWYQETRDMTKLSQINKHFITKVANKLGICHEMHSSSEIPVLGKADDYNLKLTLHLGGTHYISGLGGKKYQEEKIFTQNHVKLKVLDSKTELENMFSEVDCDKSLSVLEVLMKVDVDTIRYGFSKFVI
ncbi:MAG: WbqC family protein [Saprospiraceae bacterium]|nr:WbqC family protein [Saprospiraceae bacterium]